MWKIVKRNAPKLEEPQDQEDTDELSGWVQIPNNDTTIEIMPEADWEFVEEPKQLTNGLQRDTK